MSDASSKRVEEMQERLDEIQEEIDDAVADAEKVLPHHPAETFVDTDETDTAIVPPG